MNLVYLDELITFIVILSLVFALIFLFIITLNKNSTLEDDAYYIEGAMIGVVYSLMFSGFFFGTFHKLSANFNNKLLYLSILMFNIVIFFGQMSYNIYVNLTSIQYTEYNKFMITFNYTASITNLCIILYMLIYKPKVLV